MPKFFKYAFMLRNNSIHIGPCWTNKNQRGKGIYPAVLSKICSDYYKKNVYIFTEKENIASQKGIEKVGFKQFATGYKTRLFGVYKIKKT
jgi:predicted GNAT family acetyltransferase